MGRYAIIVGFVISFAATIYLGLIVEQQQRAIDALVSDHATTLELQSKLTGEVLRLRNAIFEQAEEGSK